MDNKKYYPNLIQAFSLLAMALFFGGIGWMFGSHANQISTAQIQKALTLAGHGKIHLVQRTGYHGIPVIEVRYPNDSLHIAYVLASHGNVYGIATGNVYQPNGSPLDKIMQPVFQRAVAAALPTVALPAATSQAAVTKAQGKPGVVEIHIPSPAVTPIAIPSDASLPGAALLPSASLPSARPPGATPDIITDPQTTERMMALTHSFLWGNNPHSPIYAFVDPNCIFCHKWYESEKANVQQGKVSFHIVMVGALKPSSPVFAAEILSSKRPLALWLRNENRFNKTTETGGISLALQQNHTVKKDVAVNTVILYRIDNKNPFTPTFADSETGQVWMGTNHNSEIAHVQ